jgi:putative tryptophan/tyrosine transport system substrate-binding protein
VNDPEALNHGSSGKRRVAARPGGVHHRADLCPVAHRTRLRPSEDGTPMRRREIPQVNSGIVEAFRQGLREAGFTENRNLKVEFRWAEDRNDRLQALAADLVHREVAVIAANSVSAVAAKAATATIPIVFQSGIDPVVAGLVASLGHPGGNTTGVSFFASTLEVKKLELLHEIVPPAAVIAVLVNPNNPQAEIQAGGLQAAAGMLHRPLAILMAGSERDIDTAFATLAQRGTAAVVVVGDPFFNSRRRQLIALAARHGIPAIYSNRENVDDGGLISYGASLAEAYREVGIYAGRHSQGRKTGGPAGAAADQVRTDRQSRDRDGARPRFAAGPARPCRQGD